MPWRRVGSFIGGAGGLNSVFQIGFSNMKPEAVVLARDLRFLSYCFKMGIAVPNFRLRINEPTRPNHDYSQGEEKSSSSRPFQV